MSSTIQIPILYEDSEVVVINKPAGLVVHPDGRTNEETLVDWISSHYPDIAQKEVGESIKLTDGGEIKKPGVVHRIDRETSGVLLIAKTQESFFNLKSQFQARTIKKNYKTICYGFFKEPKGMINKVIGRSASDFRKWSAEFGARGELREASTEYKVLGQGEVDATESKDRSEGEIKLSYLDVFPHTGRTHQIRVHLKAIGHPIVCDALYAPKMPRVLGFKRIALHASSIVFKLQNGREKKVEAPLPPDFQDGLATLEIAGV
ncbi:MAG: RluA family pseudouridine synthase [Candidatus Pacebacteria bacterium]|nr:RluA family pseudouridine synthase [Candidatus Paceibacterota bacterium]